MLKPVGVAAVIFAIWTLQGARPAPPPAPAPRWPDGRINLGAPAGEKGVWERRGEHLVVNPKSYQAPATRNARVHIASGTQAGSPASPTRGASRPAGRAS